MHDPSYKTQIISTKVYKIDKSKTNEPAMALLSGISKEKGLEFYMMFP